MSNSPYVRWKLGQWVLLWRLRCYQESVLDCKGERRKHSLLQRPAFASIPVEGDQYLPLQDVLGSSLTLSASFDLTQSLAFLCFVVLFVFCNKVAINNHQFLYLNSICSCTLKQVISLAYSSPTAFRQQSKHLV
jgi:hypothetical protein